MEQIIRTYSPRRDRAAARLLWKECGWITDEKRHHAALDLVVGAGGALVGEIEGSVECLVLSSPATLHHTGMPIPMTAITGVTTGRAARNQGIASTVVAAALAREAERGAVVAGLGMFEQGFYDRLGFGTGPYEHWIRFDPAWLTGLDRPRLPVRLGPEDWKEIHLARLSRRMMHGRVDLLPPAMTHADMLWNKNTFGLGYREGGALTHLFVAHAANVERGPYTVDWMVYRDVTQFRELLALIAGLGDQVRLVEMREPASLQMQDFLRRPFQLQAISRRGEFEVSSRAEAYWQMRVLSLEQAAEVLSSREPLRFNLTLHDPVERFLPQGSSWKGCAGDWIIRLGPRGERSSAERGVEAGLPLLEAGIGEFTRLWLGVQRATTLPASGRFSGPPDLLAALDRGLQVERPEPDWDY